MGNVTTIIKIKTGRFSRDIEIDLKDIVIDGNNKTINGMQQNVQEKINKNNEIIENNKKNTN